MREREPVGVGRRPQVDLRFADPVEEREFRAAYDDRSLPIQRGAAVLGLLLYGSFGLLDLSLAGDRAGDFLSIRFGLVLPVMALALASTFSPRLRPHMQIAFGTVIAVSGGGIVAMIALADPFVGSHYYTGLILCLFFGATLARLLTGYLLTVSVMIVAGYEVAAIVLTDTPSAILLNANFFLLTALFISLIACWLLERSERRDFRYRRSLAEDAREVAELNRRLEQLSTRDHLTGLYNRRYLDRRLTELAALHERYEIVTSVLLLDLDGFKEINDEFGHPAGDQLLRHVAAAMSASIRATDLLFRLGGDEFVVVLHSTPLEAARQVADNLRTTLARLPLPGDVERTGVAFSAGGIALDGHMGSPEDVVGALDRLLYEAKGRGKNRTLFRAVLPSSG